MKKISIYNSIILLCMVALLAGACNTTTSKAKEYNSYKGLIMAGYQGWFNTPEDGESRGWYHYNGKNGFKPGSASIDMWPDVSEYEKTYPTEFTFEDGSTARVFSSADESTVDTHFRWMKEYGLDGVFMQRFVNEIKGESGRRHFDNVLDNAMKAANKYGRAICVMYDLSGMRPGDENVILQDIERLSGLHNIKERKKNTSYLWHNGRPLVTVWGVGFNDKRAYGLTEAETIINGLHDRGFSVMLGVPTHWRSLSGDTESDPKLHELIKKCDIVMPWFVARFKENGIPRYREIVKEDVKWCKENNVDYAPLCYPGFSWKNMYGDDGSFIPRNKGSFIWKQLMGAVDAGAEMIYVAMFDEIDEGTAIFKCAKQVPVGESVFVPIEKGIETDHYLWLVGEARKILRKEQPYSKEMPLRKR